MAAPGGAGAAPIPIAAPILVPVPDPPPFPAWLAARLDALGLDRAVYGAYIEGLLREEESDEERLEALQAVLAACLVRGGGPSAAPGRWGSRRPSRADERAVLPPGLPCSPEGAGGLRPRWAGVSVGPAGRTGGAAPPEPCGASPPSRGGSRPSWEDAHLQGLFLPPPGTLQGFWCVVWGAVGWGGGLCQAWG